MKTRIHLTLIICLAVLIFSNAKCGLPPGYHMPITYTVVKHGEKFDTIKKNASLGVFCPPKIRVNETRLITVWIKVNKSKYQIRQYVRQTEMESNDWMTEGDSTSIIPISLQLYDSVKVHIDYDTTDFKIAPVVGNDKKYTKVDTTNGNLWQWTIKAVSEEKRSSRITLIVEPHTPPNRDLAPIPSHVIPITIYFDFSDMIRGWIRYIGEHPGYTVPVILVPAIIFFFKRRKKRRQNGRG